MRLLAGFRTPGHPMRGAAAGRRSAVMNHLSAGSTRRCAAPSGVERLSTASPGTPKGPAVQDLFAAAGGPRTPRRGTSPEESSVLAGCLFGRRCCAHRVMSDPPKSSGGTSRSWATCAHRPRRSATCWTRRFASPSARTRSTRRTRCGAALPPSHLPRRQASAGDADVRGPRGRRCGRSRRGPGGVARNDRRGGGRARPRHGARRAHRGLADGRGRTHPRGRDLRLLRARAVGRRSGCVTCRDRVGLRRRRVRSPPSGRPSTRPDKTKPPMEPGVTADVGGGTRTPDTRIMIPRCGGVEAGRVGPTPVVDGLRATATPVESGGVSGGPVPSLFTQPASSTPIGPNQPYVSSGARRRGLHRPLLNSRCSPGHTTLKALAFAVALNSNRLLAATGVRRSFLVGLPPQPTRATARRADVATIALLMTGQGRSGAASHRVRGEPPASTPRWQPAGQPAQRCPDHGSPTAEAACRDYIAARRTAHEPVKDRGSTPGRELLLPPVAAPETAKPRVAYPPAPGVSVVLDSDS